MLLSNLYGLMWSRSFQTSLVNKNSRLMLSFFGGTSSNQPTPVTVLLYLIFFLVKRWIYMKRWNNPPLLHQTSNFNENEFLHLLALQFSGDVTVNGKLSQMQVSISPTSYAQKLKEQLSCTSTSSLQKENWQKLCL
jgi:hypothetical protein